MKHWGISYWLGAFTCLLLLSSCGPEGDKFRLSGRLRNINQGDFFVYSTDGAFVGIDTIKVRNGRFSYEKEMRKDFTLMLVFPNFSEQAVFASPGEEVEIKGDATHLREMTIYGTDENDELTKLRIRLNKLTPPEVAGEVAKFIEENPTSIVSIHLLDRYFVSTKTPDYTEAQRLAALMLKANPDNGQIRKLKKQIDGLKNNRLQAMLPIITATDLKRTEDNNRTTERKSRCYLYMGNMELSQYGYPTQTAKTAEEISTGFIFDQYLSGRQQAGM